jgi:hypothetical protein
MKEKLLRPVYNKLNSILYNFKAGKHSATLKKNSQLKDSAAGVRRCFILATGPSISTQDLSSLEGEFCISVSNFFVHPLFNTIQPHYHLFAGTHPPITEEQVTDWWQDAENHMEGNKKTSIVLYAKDKRLVESKNLFKGREKYYYLSNGDFPVDLTRQLPDMQTVIHPAIYLAIYAGIKEIYLLGVDHSWLLHFGESKHFYREEEHSLTRNKYNEWGGIKDIGEDFRHHAHLWDIYRDIRSEAGKVGVSIFNASPGSLLDIFPRVNFNSIFNPAKKDG